MYDEIIITTIIVILVEVSFTLPSNIGIGDNQRVDESGDEQDGADDADDDNHRDAGDDNHRDADNDNHRDADNDNDRDISGSVDDLVNLGRCPVVVLWVEPGELPTVPGF